MAKPQKKNNFWLPEIHDLASAQSAAHQGVWVCVLIIVVSWIFSVVFATANMTPNYQPLILASIAYGFIGMMIYRMSRLAAIAGLVLYLIDRIAVIAQTGGGTGNVSMMVLFIFAFANSIRGTFAYHRMKHDRQMELSQSEVELVEYPD
jgi:hypothetical protein